MVLVLLVVVVLVRLFPVVVTSVVVMKARL